MSIGLVLEGGGNRGVFTGGVLDKFLEEELFFDYVVGVSAGACNAIDFLSKQQGRTLDVFSYNPKKMLKDYSYILRDKELLNMTELFVDYPERLFPFDYDTYFASPSKCELVVTNCITGKAEYMEAKDDKEMLYLYCKASSTMPFYCQPVEINGMPYFDGGIADSIPVARSIKQGNKKHIIILTQPEGFIKERNQVMEKLAIVLYKKYPYLVRRIHCRHLEYNRSLALVKKLEEKGLAYVIRPTLPSIKRLNTPEKELFDYYQSGYDFAVEHIAQIKEFMKQEIE